MLSSSSWRLRRRRVVVAAVRRPLVHPNPQHSCKIPHDRMS
ncbi:hypothetical protein AKJ09_06875 [Labilithrix luteola]|uniref:Uncharacterized protein n=1 Tax=Labilithrix luteola TaxID=1391654 RepID=A0A0K1Q3L6_9BACT|nr:hypothetical protein AKJ09_06875 [Labilithrix luteola]